MKEIVTGAAAIIIAAIFLNGMGIRDDGSLDAPVRMEASQDIAPTPIDLNKVVSPALYSLSRDRHRLFLAPLAKNERWAVVHDGTHRNGKYVDAGTYSTGSELTNVAVYITRDGASITGLTSIPE